MANHALREADWFTSDKVVAIVLGGGRGTRLYPLTRDRAKPAVPLGGRYRLVDIPISNCIHSGINRMFVLTQFNSRSLHRHINETYKFDAFTKGFVEILAAEQTVTSGDWFQGTADAIRQSLWHLRSTDCEHYLILSGDHLYRMDYRDFLDRHLQSDADITVSILPVDAKAAKGFGIMKCEPDGTISEFVEKPQTPEELAPLRTPPEVMAEFGFDAPGGREYLASMGVYLFKRDVMVSLLQERMDWIDFGKHIIPNSLGKHKVSAHLFADFWEDIGTVRSYYEVSMDLVGVNPPFDFHQPGKPIYSRARYLPGARILRAQVDSSFICEGSTIEDANIERSIVGIRSMVRPGAVIKDSILMGADYFEGETAAAGPSLGIGAGSTIEHAIIDKNVHIGRNVTIRGSEALEDCTEDDYAIVDGIAIVLKNAVIADGTHIGA